MEKVPSDLRLSELKQGEFNKAIEELLSRTSSEWKDLENNLDSTWTLIRIQFERLVERENEILSKEKQLEAKELELKVKKLNEKEKLSGELSEEIEVKKQQCNAIRISIEEKEREFDHIKKSISKAENTLDLLERSIKQRYLENQGMLKNFEQVVELKEDLLNGMQRSIEKCLKEFRLKNEQLEVCQSSLDECDKEIKLKEEKLNSIQKSLVECSDELKLKEQQLDLVRKLKEENLCSLEKLMDKCAHELEMKERKFENFVNAVDLKEKLLESKFKELDLIDKKVDRCLKEVELKVINFASVQNLVEERFHELEIKENELERRVNEFKLRQEEFESVQKSAEIGVEEKTGILPPVVMIEELEQIHSSSAYHQSCMPKEKKDLFWLLNQHLKRHDLVCSGIFSILKAALDPAKLAMDAIHGIYHLRLSRDDTEFDDSIAMRGCNLLLELLMKTSPKITPEVREEAMKLASDWNAKITVGSDNCLEAFEFLHFLVSFRLASSFDENELHSLLDIVGLQGQASQSHSVTDIAREECIQTLIRRGEIIRAVRLICDLKLTDKYPPVSLLIQYLADAEISTQIACRKRKFNEAKKKAMDKELDTLKAVMECIELCNLKTEFPSEKISKRIGVLENVGKLLENVGELLDHEIEQPKNKKQRNNSCSPKEHTQLSKNKCPWTTQLDNAVGAKTGSGSASPQPTLPNDFTTNLANTVGANTSAGSAFPRPPPPIVLTTGLDIPVGANAIDANASAGLTSPQSHSPNVWTKPPEGFIKLNFGFVGRLNCGFLSVVARDNNGAVLAIWCQKTPQSDPLIGEALAAQGALTLASSKGWDAIFLEGDSPELISYLQKSCEPMLSVSSIVSDSVALIQSFRRAIPVWIPPESNSLARNVSQWAAGNNVQDGLSWISVPSSLFYIFHEL